MKQHNQDLLAGAIIAAALATGVSLLGVRAYELRQARSAPQVERKVSGPEPYCHAKAHGFYLPCRYSSKVYDA